MSGRFVAYYRVSTRKQGASGLGLEAQREAVKAFVSGNGKLLREFQEIESGKKSDRPELAAALAHAKRAGAVLLVAKLDRLARNVAFLATLMQSGVEFVCCDNPHANKFTIHVLAAVAEWEREQISGRTKAALAQAKARGTLLGSAAPGHWEGREDRRLAGALKGAKRAAKVRTQKAREEYADLVPVVREMHEAGKSLREIAAALNEQGHTTRRGNAFMAPQIQRILEMAEK